MPQQAGDIERFDFQLIIRRRQFAIDIDFELVVSRDIQDGLPRILQLDPFAKVRRAG